MKKINDGIYYVGVDDVKIDLFEGNLPVPNGVSYNSYVIKDDKCAVMDSVDAAFGEEWLKEVEWALQGAEPDYLVVLHMEPDHSANIYNFAQKYPNSFIVGNNKTFVMLQEYFGTDFADRRVVVKDGEKLNLGKHELTFIFAPMVHWPEVMTAYESYTRAYFSADAFGKFGALSKGGEWDDEARRYYFAIVGKYGVQVQALLKKVSEYEIAAIYPLHGPVLENNLGHFLNLYSLWSEYKPETDGVFVAYSSVYGHTALAVEKFVGMLKEKGVNAEACDVIRTDRTQCIAKAFKYSKIVFATTTYNGGIFPSMREFIESLVERNFRNRKIGLIENGSWAPFAAKAITSMLENCKDLTFATTTVKIRSALNAQSSEELKCLAAEMSE